MRKLQILLRPFFFLFSFFLLLNLSCKQEDLPPGEALLITGVKIGSKTLNLNNPVLNDAVPVDQPLILTFNQAVDENSLSGGILLSDLIHPDIPFTFSLQDQGLTVVATPTGALDFSQEFTLKITAALKSKTGQSCQPQDVHFSTKQGELKIESILADGKNLLVNPPARDINRNFVARVRFDRALDITTVSTANVKLFKNGEFAQIQLSFDNQDSTLVIAAEQPLRHYEKYTLYLGFSIKAPGGYNLTDFSKVFYTALDATPKFPLLNDSELLDLVQEQTFKYFWDFGHPVSGLSRERNTSGDLVTSGGSGFGIMSIIVGIERGFITRSEGVARWQKITGFLKNNAQRYHGAWPHWLNGATGATIPFSTKDNGADLVETSYLVQGLLTVRQYLNPADPVENQLIADIQHLWETVEWDWFTRGGQNVLYWHWSPNYNWEMNHQIKGYNECLITYFLAACSPTHPITPAVYHQGWASSGGIVNNNTYYGYQLPLGFPYGGPLFFAHYSFLGLDPRNLNDTYANYWTQNKNHTLINRAYCVANPLNKIGYGEQCWGLTASDNHVGYNAHSPTNDLGVITPTAALSSFPYTPDESMTALKFFYYQLGDKLWGNHGFYDAFNVTEGWYGDSFLAIDQGPILLMIENHRTGKLWDLFMSAPEVPVGAALLGFTY